jgi:hypothetical protein
MTKFLQEIWELWYWAMFFPSKLQKRMNAWAPKVKEGESVDTAFNDILFFAINWRFAGQYLLVISLFCGPLIGFLSFNQTPLDWFFLPAALFTAYGLACWFLPMGIHVPLMFSFLYGTIPKTLSTNLALGVAEIQTNLPYLNQFVLGVTVGSVLLGITVAVATALLQQKRL